MLDKVQNYYDGVAQKIKSKKYNTMSVFYLFIAIRLIVPFYLFKKFNPLFAILFNEIVLDGFFSPHHFAKFTMPEKYQIFANNFYTDKPLDTWGFLLALQPVVDKNNKFYHVFEDYRGLIVSLFVLRLIGYIIFLVTRCKQVFIYFPNIFLFAYSIISFFKLYTKNVSNKTINIFIIIGSVIAVYREYSLHSSYFSETEKKFSI
jgi:hypothetical protein